MSEDQVTPAENEVMAAQEVPVFNPANAVKEIRKFITTLDCIDGECCAHGVVVSNNILNAQTALGIVAQAIEDHM